MNIADLLQSLLLGFGLSMDAASVSITDTMFEQKMTLKKMIFIAVLFGVFQGVMPLIGYLIGSIFSENLTRFIPIIAFVLLVFLGIKMIIENLKKEDEKVVNLSIGTIIIQAIATSIDALTTGLIYINKNINFVLIVFSIVAIVTFIMSFLALLLGKKFGQIFSKYAPNVGGAILILIGCKFLIEYFI